MEEETQQAPRLFNPAAEFTIAILSGTEKRAKMRYPTDAEWCERARKISVIQKDLGRGEYEADAPGAEQADAALFEKIRLDKSEEFDDAEASAFVARLESLRLGETTREGNTFRIEMTALGRYPIAHTLRIPTQRELLDFRRATFKRKLGRGYERLETRLEPGGALYDALKVSAEGYASDAVPIPHKDAAVTELLRQLRLLEDPEA